MPNGWATKAHCSCHALRIGPIFLQVGQCDGGFTLSPTRFNTLQRTDARACWAASVTEKTQGTAERTLANRIFCSIYCYI